MQTLNYFDNFYVSVYTYLNSNMYLILDGNEAIIIDPHYNIDIELLLNKHNIHKTIILITHEHPDHISGVWWFLENFDCSLICSSRCAFQISNKKCTRPLLISFILEKEDKKNGTNILKEFKKDYVWTTYKTDIIYDEYFQKKWQGHVFNFLTTEGHSVGSSIIILDNKFVFSGDSLLKDYPVIISFPTSNREIFINKTLPLLEKVLQPEMVILPGHGNPFLLKDIMREGKINVELR